MIEVHVTYNLVQGTDEQAYSDWMRKAIVPVMRAPGILEVRAHRSMLGSPQVLIISVWKSLTDWAKFAETEAWHTLIAKLQSSLATNIRIELWGPSPVVPDPIHPPKT
jgi:heme-degrading monooxygenase HmoA